VTVILLIRFIHGLFTAFFLTCIGYVYYAALTGKRGRLLYGAVAALTVEGIIVMANGGDCPLGGIHRRHGDDRDFFELIMPKRLSKRAVRC
jgi:cbb3-type cytochrome oxidase subunit 3